LLFDMLLSAAASIVNRGIDDDDEAQNLSDALDGRSLRITARPVPQPVLIAITDGLFELSTDTQRAADAEIAGTLIELNRLMFIDNQAPIREGHVQVTGDVDIADQFRELLLCARPDLEEKLAEWFGKSAATRVASVVRDTRDWATGVAEDATDRAADFLHEDSVQLPTHREINAHFDAVDDLVNAVERVEARLSRLAETPTT